jgi:nascent polypeptide-associated complex subunit alpha
MFPNIDPKKMQAVMRQMGISQEEIDALRVIIEKPDGKIIIENPSVTRVKMNGQESFQISGDIKEEAEKLSDSEDDIRTIVEKTGCSEKQARKALEETGDLAEAIMKLS